MISKRGWVKLFITVVAYSLVLTLLVSAMPVDQHQAMAFEKPAWAEELQKPTTMAPSDIPEKPPVARFQKPTTTAPPDMPEKPPVAQFQKPTTAPVPSSDKAPAAKSQKPIPQDAKLALEEAWSAWQKGDVPYAEKLAKGLPETPDKRHLLLLCAFVKGDYEEALLHHSEIDLSYPRYSELDRPVVEAYLHLSRYAEAERFARERKMDENLLEKLAERSKQPLKVTLKDITEIPFAEHPLSEYFPAFEVEISGKKFIAHIDTGGTFLHMGPDTAKELRIKLTKGGEAIAATQSVQTYHGIAQNFRLGEALLENVPVSVIPLLEGQLDFIIFGTNILEQFISTLDYPNKRLVLSPRNDSYLKRKHLWMLHDYHTRIPFYMWGDHFMFARGGVGEHRNLNFFIDSGLVFLVPDGKGGLLQPSFQSTPNNFEAWGLNPDEVRQGFFESPVPLSLGPLEQTGLFFLANDWEHGPFGGIQIHGLLSHAFLKQYTWTLDFDQHIYIFSW